MEARKVYGICNVGIEIICDNEELHANLERLWQQLFVLRCDGQAAQIIFQLDVQGSEIVSDCEEELVGASLLYRSTDYALYRAGSHFCLCCGASTVWMEPATGSVRGRLAEPFWSHPRHVLRDFFIALFWLLLRPHGHYGIHANGVEKDGPGLLIAGDSGYGKTTLTMALLHSGWRCFGDDALTLSQTNSGADRGVEAFALRRGLAIASDAEHHFPDLVRPTTPTLSLNNGKRLVYLEEGSPNRWLSRCAVGGILFPKIVDSDVSQLHPLDKTTAFAALIGQSHGMTLDRTLASAQMMFLKELIQQTRQYQLLLGRDVFENPMALSRLLGQLG